MIRLDVSIPFPHYIIMSLFLAGSVTIPKQDSQTLPGGGHPIQEAGGALKMMKREKYNQAFERNMVDERPREIQLLNWALGCVSRGGHSTQVVGRRGGAGREVGKLHNRRASVVVGAESAIGTNCRRKTGAEPRSSISTPNIERGTNNQMMMEWPPLRP